MSSISDAVITQGLDVPAMKWPFQSMTQAFAYAVDPKTEIEYLFVAQAKATDSGEDSYYHRHRVEGDTVTYLDTMIGVNFGHPQNFHVRISAAGNPWIWASVSQYKSGQVVAGKVARVLYRKGKVTAKSAHFAYINTGPVGSVAAISCSPWTIVLRRGHDTSETYEEHDERKLMNGIYHPIRSFSRDKQSTFYQSSCATPSSVWVVTGETNHVNEVFQHDWSHRQAGYQDISDLNIDGHVTSDEPEGVGIVRGSLNVAKRYNSVSRRRYVLWSFDW